MLYTTYYSNASFLYLYLYLIYIISYAYIYTYIFILILHTYSNTSRIMHKSSANLSFAGIAIYKTQPPHRPRQYRGHHLRRLWGLRLGLLPATPSAAPRWGGRGPGLLGGPPGGSAGPGGNGAPPAGPGETGRAETYQREAAERYDGGAEEAGERVSGGQSGGGDWYLCSYVHFPMFLLVFFISDCWLFYFVMLTSLI